jgi:hypothetical protein
MALLYSSSRPVRGGPVPSDIQVKSRVSPLRIDDRLAQR